MKTSLLILIACVFSINAFAQNAVKDTTIKEKEPIAIGEIGPAASLGVNGSRSGLGYGLAVEVTPIEDWLELELGVGNTYASHFRETDIDFLIKKPWTLSKQVEFMLGAGPSYGHTIEQGVTSNDWSGELALDFMFWPFAKRQFGLYAEPAYDYGFGKEHEQGIGISGGLLIAIP